MAKTVKSVLLVLLALVLVCVIAFCAFYWGRFRSIASIEKMTDYEDYNLYRMNIEYDYDLDALIARGITDNQSFIDAILKEALPLLPIHMEAPSFACSAFTLTDTDGDVHMGRNYDFSRDTSAMLVYCTPKYGYRSVALAALDNIGASTLENSLAKKVATLTAPFICLDGMNEKGVSIAVLTLDSEPTFQQTGKPAIATSTAIRLVLDRAATTQEAVELLESYDMFAVAGRDYHFYITDASGDGCVIEYDCEDPARPLVATRTDVLTNFFMLYKDQVLPNQKNGIYGHGRERYDAIEEVLASEPEHTVATVWQALQAAAQDPNPEDVTSNTQWSLNYNNTDKTVEIVLRRHWNDHFTYDLNTNSF